MQTHFANMPVFKQAAAVGQYGANGWVYECRDCDFVTSFSCLGTNAELNQTWRERREHYDAVRAASAQR